MILKFIGKILGGKKSPGRGEPGSPQPATARPPDAPGKDAYPQRKRRGKKKSSATGAAGGKKNGNRRPPGKPVPKKTDTQRHSRTKGTRGARISWPELPPMPPWTPPDDPSLFENYDLPEEVKRGIASAGFTSCTEVQRKALPLSLQGIDIAAQSQTGTGKTATFLITIFSRLLRRGPTGHPGPRALVISPTRELAVQIENDARILGHHTGISRALVFGGVDYEKQRRRLLEGPDLIVGTPGRLIDYMKQGAWRPEGVEILVIDEADRMFDMGFIRDLRYILRRLPPYDRRQSMLFSATLNWRVMELTYEYMNLPRQITISPEQIDAENAEQVLYHVSRDEKPALFLGLMNSEPWKRTLVFTNMKIEAEKVARLLKHHGYHARAITGNLDQAKRLRLMAQFKKGELPVLVATDVASRGLHVEGVTHVINWDLPQDPEDYVHRIGRTARAGAAGKAISLADENTVYHLEPIEKLIGRKIPVVWHDSDDLAEVKNGWQKKSPVKRGPSTSRRRGSRARGAR